jgi:hypothetical protein
MLARENYSYKKQQRELAGKKKAEEKKKRKLEKIAMEVRLEAGHAPDEQAPAV